MTDLYHDIANIINREICDSEETYDGFLRRLAEGNLTREENNLTHFCVFFLPYNPADKKVFIGDHKKSGLWLSPGGHIEKDERLVEALNREIGEELGVKDFFRESEAKPFLLTISHIGEEMRHYDIWFLMKTDGADFIVDPGEFYEARWMTIEEAEKMKTSPPNLAALKVIEYKRKGPARMKP